MINRIEKGVAAVSVVCVLLSLQGCGPGDVSSAEKESVSKNVETVGKRVQNAVEMRAGSPNDAERAKQPQLLHPRSKPSRSGLNLDVGDVFANVPTVPYAEQERDEFPAFTVSGRIQRAKATSDADVDPGPGFEPGPSTEALFHAWTEFIETGGESGFKGVVEGSSLWDDFLTNRWDVSGHRDESGHQVGIKQDDIKFKSGVQAFRDYDVLPMQHWPELMSIGLQFASEPLVKLVLFLLARLEVLPVCTSSGPLLGVDVRGTKCSCQSTSNSKGDKFGQTWGFSTRCEKRAKWFLSLSSALAAPLDKFREMCVANADLKADMRKLRSVVSMQPQIQIENQTKVEVYKTESTHLRDYRAILTDTNAKALDAVLKMVEVEAELKHKYVHFMDWECAAQNPPTPAMVTKEMVEMSLMCKQHMEVATRFLREVKDGKFQKPEDVMVVRIVVFHAAAKFPIRLRELMLAVLQGVDCIMQGPWPEDGQAGAKVRVEESLRQFQDSGANVRPFLDALAEAVRAL